MSLNTTQQGRNGKPGKLERNAAKEFVELVMHGRKRQALEFYRGSEVKAQEYIRKRYQGYLDTARCQF